MNVSYVYFCIFRYDLEGKLGTAEENLNEISQVQKECVDKLTKLREEKSEKDKILKQQAE